MFKRLDWDSDVIHRFAMVLMGDWLSENRPADKPYAIEGSFYLKNIKNGKYINHVNGQAQQAICVFCNKAVASWGKIRSASDRYNSFNIKQLEQGRIHTRKCSSDWLRITLCQWSLGSMRYDKYIKKMIVDFKNDQDRHRRYQSYAYGESQPYQAEGLFDCLPVKPGLPETVHLEIFLTSLCD